MKIVLTAERRTASGSIKQREGHMTDSPESMSKILFETGGPKRGGGMEAGLDGSAHD